MFTKTRKFFIVLYVFFLIHPVLSQTKYLPVFRNGYWSVADTNLNLLFPYKFEDIKISSDGLIVAKEKGSVYLIRDNKQLELPDEIQHIEFLPGRFIKVMNDNKCGILDSLGQAILDIKYDHIRPQSINYAIVWDGNKQLLFNMISREMSYPCDSIRYLGNVYYQLFKDSLFVITNPDKKIISSRYKSLIEIHPDVFFCTARLGEKYVVSFSDQPRETETDFFYYASIDNRFIFCRQDSMLEVNDLIQNKTYTLVAESVYRLKNNVQRNKLGKLFLDYPLFGFEQNGLIGVLNEKMQIILKAEYESVEIRDTLIVLRKNGKKMLATQQGKIIIKPVYDDFTQLGNYWLVREGNLYGIISLSGTEIINPLYDNIEPLEKDLFIVGKNGKKGLVNKQNKNIIPIEYDKLQIIGNALIFKQNGQFGLISIDGRVLFPAEFKNLSVLNDKFLLFTQDQKQGIMDKNGKIKFKAQFLTISGTKHPNLFLVNNKQYSTLTREELIQSFKLNTKEINNDFVENRYKTGVINSSGEIMLDPVYDPYLLSFDYEGNTIVARQENGVLIVNFDANGSVLEKTFYKNFISVNKGKTAVNTDSLPYVWRGRTDNDRIFRYGLFHLSDRKIIDFYYKNVYPCPFNQELSVTEGPEGKLGIVSRRTGRVKLEDVYQTIHFDDLSVINVARCVKSSGFITLIDSNANVIDKSVTFMDEPNSQPMRINKGGKLVMTDPGHPKKLYTDPKTIRGINRNEGQFNVNRALIGGKWGIMDNYGKYTVEPKYSFLQICFNGVFIAEKNGMWGVISPKEDVLIEFKYDEIRHLQDTATNYWANTPYYKVRIGKSWGIIDSAGNEIIPANYADIDCIFINKTCFFKPAIDQIPETYSLVNEQGVLANNFQFPFIGQFTSGNARVQLSNRCWKFANKNLSLFPDNCFLETRNFSDGLAAVKTRDGWGYIDEKGNLAIPCQYPEASDFNEGFARIKVKTSSGLFRLKKSKYNNVLIDKNNRIIYNPKADWLGDVMHGQLVLGMKRKYTVRTVKGKKVLPESYMQILRYPDDSLYLVKKNKDLAALYNFKGNLIVPFGKYQKYSGFSENLCFVTGNETGFIDSRGNMRFKIQCEEALSFHEGLAAIKIDRKWGFIDTSGKWVIEPQYLRVENFEYGYARVVDFSYNPCKIDRANRKVSDNRIAENKNQIIYSEGKYQGIKSKNGNTIILPVANEISFFSEGNARIKIQRVYGLTDNTGKFLVQPEYPIISIMPNGFLRLMNANEMCYFR